MVKFKALPSSVLSTLPFHTFWCRIVFAKSGHTRHEITRILPLACDILLDCWAGFRPILLVRGHSYWRCALAYTLLHPRKGMYVTT